MHVTLPSDLERFVERQVATGIFHDSADVITEALRLLEAQQQEEASRLATLREALQAGEASGPARPLDMDAIINELDCERGAR